MKIKTVYKRASRAEAFDKEVNKLLEEGWTLKGRYITDPKVSEYVPMLYAEFEKPDAEDMPKEAPASDPYQTTVTLEPDIEYLLQIKRGTSSLEDYLNTVIPLGVACADRFKGKMEEAVNQILYGKFIDEEEEEDAEV